jgi:ABC-2 type transport system permease protein
MKAYLAVFRIRLLAGLQYRVAALAGIATQFFWGFVAIMVYEAFYHNASIAPSITLRQLVSYIWLQQAFLNFIMLTFRDGELLQLIISGDVAYEYCRPCNLYGFWYAKLVGQRLSGAMLRCAPIIGVTLLLPRPYGLSLPASWVSFGLFAFTLALGLLVIVAISMLIYISVFITMSPGGSLMLIAIGGEFLSGLVLPVPLMPDWLQRIVYWLPFRWTADFPLRVYSGNIPVNEALTGIEIQLVWLMLLIVLGKTALDRIARHIVVQGG